MPLEFRDKRQAHALGEALARATARIGRSPVSVMHVCGSHEQAIAKFGLRASFPPDLNVIMGPGCPVCITDQPEIDDGIDCRMGEPAELCLGASQCEPFDA